MLTFFFVFVWMGFFATFVCAKREQRFFLYYNEGIFDNSSFEKADEKRTNREMGDREIRDWNVGARRTKQFSSCRVAHLFWSVDGAERTKSSGALYKNTPEDVT